MAHLLLADSLIGTCCLVVRSCSEVSHANYVEESCGDPYCSSVKSLHGSFKTSGPVCVAAPMHGVWLLWPCISLWKLSRETQHATGRFRNMEVPLAAETSGVCKGLCGVLLMT